jgi:hypothetical protein
VASSTVRMTAVQASYCLNVWDSLPRMWSRDYAPFEIAVHDGEEDLEEQVDGVYQHRQQIEPCFSRHCVDEHLGSRQERSMERDFNV